MAKVKLFGNLRNYIENSHLQISGSSVRAVVEALCERIPSLCDELLENGAIRPHYKIIINGHDVTWFDGLDTVVEEEDNIAIFSPIAGG